MELVSCIALRLFLMIVPSIIVAESQIANSNPLDTNNLPPETETTATTISRPSNNELEMAPPLIGYDNQPRAPINRPHRTILIMGSLFSQQKPSELASNLGPIKRMPDSGDYPIQKPDVVADRGATGAGSEKNLQDLIVRWLEQMRGSSSLMIKENGDDHHRQLYVGDNNRSRRIQLPATTTARPAYDQIPRPLLFDGVDSFGLEPIISDHDYHHE